MGLTPQASQMGWSQTYQLIFKCAQLALIPPVEILEDNLMVGSSNWDDEKKTSNLGYTSPPLKPAIKWTPTGYYIVCHSNYVSTNPQY